MTKKKIKKQKAEKVSKLNVWFKHYINADCSTTFLNKSNSVIAAGYKTTKPESIRVIGYQNFIKLTDKINKWLDEEGLSESALKLKLLELMNTKETKFIKLKGAVAKKDLPDNTRLITSTGFIAYGEDGLEYGDGDTLIAVDTAAIETQRKTLDMALKVKGMNAPEKHEHKGKIDSELTIRFVDGDKPEKEDNPKDEDK